MNIPQTDKLRRRTADRRDEQEELRTMHALLDENVLPQVSLTAHLESTPIPELLEQSSEEDERYAPLYDDLIDPTLSTVGSEKFQKLRPCDANRDKRVKRSSINKTRVLKMSSKSKRSAKAGGKRRGSRRKTKRQGTQAADGEKWTELVQNLITLMRASKGCEDAKQRREKKAAFRRKVTVLLLPFFKKPKEASTFLALFDAREQTLKERELSQLEQRSMRQGHEDRSFEMQSEQRELMGSRSDQIGHRPGKKSVIWSMFSVDWDSTRVQRRRAARQRAMQKSAPSADCKLKEFRENSAERSSQSYQSMAQPKGNSAAEMRRENERQRLRLMKDEIIARTLEHIRMMVTLKKLCRPRLLARLRQEAAAYGVSESFEKFASTLPLDGDINRCLANGSKNSGVTEKDFDELLEGLSQTKQKRDSDNCSSTGVDTTTKGVHSFSKSSSEGGSESSFSNLSYQLHELEDVIRTALDDFDPEEEN